MTGIEATALSPFEDGFRTVTLACGDVCWDVRARVVVAADGVESRVARWAGIATHTAVHDMETCAQVTCAGVDVDSESFSLCFSNELSPGGLAWTWRIEAAVCAAEAGSGVGPHADAFDQDQRAEARARALATLRKVLVLADERISGGDEAQRERAWRALRSLRFNLEPLRYGKFEASLPEAERAAWRAFWEDHNRLMRRARGQ